MLGPDVWQHTVLGLTRAQMTSPPPGTTYGELCPSRMLISRQYCIVRCVAAHHPGLHAGAGDIAAAWHHLRQAFRLATMPIAKDESLTVQDSAAWGATWHDVTHMGLGIGGAPLRISTASASWRPQRHVLTSHVPVLQRAS